MPSLCGLFNVDVKKITEDNNLLAMDAQKSFLTLKFSSVIAMNMLNLCVIVESVKDTTVGIVSKCFSVQAVSRLHVKNAKR